MSQHLLKPKAHKSALANYPRKGITPERLKGSKQGITITKIMYDTNTISDYPLSQINYFSPTTLTILYSRTSKYIFFDYLEIDKAITDIES